MLPLVRTCYKPLIPITCIIWRELVIWAVSGTEVAASLSLPPIQDWLHPSLYSLRPSSIHPPSAHPFIHCLSIVHLTHLHNFSCIHLSYQLSIHPSSYHLTILSSIHPSIHPSIHFISFCLVPNNVLMPNRIQFPQGSRSHKASTASLENILHAP